MFFLSFFVLIYACSQGLLLSICSTICALRLVLVSISSVVFCAVCGIYDSTYYTM
ncbi:hypothetical protein BDR03DRAFT_966015 [Suillus americanus]|nr:hypothetical protein BDR03DRAFT_966015 [Suillus americanus]